MKLEEKRKAFLLHGVTNFEARDYIRALEEKIIEYERREYVSSGQNSSRGKN